MIETSSGMVSVLDTGGTGMAVLFVHGNSFSKDVFARQFEGDLCRRHRLIAIDLPGHGDSDDAHDPAATYCVPGYAHACAEALEALGVREAVVIGWSLGGHVALELADRSRAVTGVMMVGAPPHSRGVLALMRAFNAHPALLLATRGRLTAPEARLFARLCLGAAAGPESTAMILRTDPRARKLLFRSMMRGEGADQKQLAESLTQPVAIVNGSREPLVRASGLGSVNWANLWQGRPQVVDDAGHAPFLEAPEVFNAILARFVGDVANGRAPPAAARGDHSRLSA
jgi:pimeloyl-ACP methyl ester carboxylesterase